MSAASGSDDEAPFTPVPVRTRSRARNRWQQAVDGIREERTVDTRSWLVSGTVTRALGRAPSFLEPSSAIDVDRKGSGYLEQELPSPGPPTLVPPSAEHLPPDSADSGPAGQWQSQAVAFAATEPHAAESLGTAGAWQGERLLHLALPWVFGQRVLAMMAGEAGDARSVESGGSEPLPAYEPRGEREGDFLVCPRGIA